MMYENNVSPNINVTTYRFLNNQMVIQELKIISEMKKSLEELNNSFFFFSINNRFELKNEKQGTRQCVR